jgi:phosphonate transport system substrate-binding protein
MRRSPYSSGLLIFLVLILALASCSGDGNTTPTPTTTPQPSITPTFLPTGTPTPQPVGTSANPIVIGVVSISGNPQVQAAGEKVISQLSSQTGYSYKIQIFSSYPALLAALGEDRVQVTWLPPLTYIYAHQRGYANVALVTNHFGLYSYGSQFMANADSGFTTYYDPEKAQDTAAAAVALKQFAGKIPCWVDPQSASGYVVPVGLLMQAGVTLPQGVIAISHGAVVRALYVGGICDYGATFGISGDPRTAQSILTELPDVMNKVVIIWRSDAIIPNLNVSFNPKLISAAAQLTRDGLVQIAQTEVGRQALSSLNEYDISDLKAVDDTYYDDLRSVVEASKVNVSTLVGK